MLLKEEINKNPISESAGLFLTPTKCQNGNPINSETYHLKSFSEKINKKIPQY